MQRLEIGILFQAQPGFSGERSPRRTASWKRTQPACPRAPERKPGRKPRRPSSVCRNVPSASAQRFSLFKSMPKPCEVTKVSECSGPNVLRSVSRVWRTSCSASAYWPSAVNTSARFPMLPHGQLVLVAIIRDGHAGDILHHEVGPALRRGAGVEDFGDGRVVHERQRLPLGFEARHHFARIHARLDQLDSDAPANRLLLLGQPHLTHAALADQLEQTIGTDYRAGGRLTRSDRAGDELLFAVPRDCGAFA